jgi:hypothetical protein
LTHFLATRIKSLINYFFHLWSGFLTSEVAEKCFYALAHTSRPPELSP